MAYPHKWSPISYKSSAGQRKHIVQRPMLYRWTTPPTDSRCRDSHTPSRIGTTALPGPLDWSGRNSEAEMASRPLKSRMTAWQLVYWCTHCGPLVHSVDGFANAITLGTPSQSPCSLSQTQ